MKFKYFILAFIIVLLAGCGEPPTDNRDNLIRALQGQVQDLKRQIAIEKTPQSELQEKHEQLVAALNQEWRKKVEAANQQRLEEVTQLTTELATARSNAVLDELLPLQKTIKAQADALRALEQRIIGLERREDSLTMEVRRVKSELSDKSNKGHSHHR